MSNASLNNAFPHRHRRGCSEPARIGTGCLHEATVLRLARHCYGLRNSVPLFPNCLSLDSCPPALGTPPPIARLAGKFLPCNRLAAFQHLLRGNRFAGSSDVGDHVCKTIVASCGLQGQKLDLVVGWRACLPKSDGATDQQRDDNESG